MVECISEKRLMVLMQKADLRRSARLVWSTGLSIFSLNFDLWRCGVML